MPTPSLTTYITDDIHKQGMAQSGDKVMHTTLNVWSVGGRSLMEYGERPKKRSPSLSFFSGPRASVENPVVQPRERHDPFSAVLLCVAVILLFDG